MPPHFLIVFAQKTEVSLPASAHVNPREHAQITDCHDAPEVGSLFSAGRHDGVVAVRRSGRGGAPLASVAGVRTCTQGSASGRCCAVAPADDPRRTDAAGALTRCRRAACCRDPPRRSTPRAAGERAARAAPTRRARTGENDPHRGRGAAGHRWVRAASGSCRAASAVACVQAARSSACRTCCPRHFGRRLDAGMRLGPRWVPARLAVR
jgi:hypothetical protein